MKNLLFIPQASRSSTLAILLLVISNTLFGQWKATITTNIFGGESEYIVYSDLSRYCLEYKYSEDSGSLIVLPKVNTSSFLSFSTKVVHHTPTDGRISFSNDPVQSLKYFLQDGGELIEELEVFGGYDCIKKTIQKDGRPIYIQWFSEELNFPLKILLPSKEDKKMLLTNITPWVVDDDKFQVPDNYIEVDWNQRPVQENY